MKPAAIPEEVVQIVTASIIFFVCAHYIIEKMISMRSAKKEEQTNEYCNDFKYSCFLYDCVCGAADLH